MEFILDVVSMREPLLNDQIKEPVCEIESQETAYRSMRRSFPAVVTRVIPRVCIMMLGILPSELC